MANFQKNGANVNGQVLPVPGTTYEIGLWGPIDTRNGKTLTVSTSPPNAAVTVTPGPMLTGKDANVKKYTLSGLKTGRIVLQATDEGGSVWTSVTLDVALRQVQITIDDAPGPSNAQMLALLARHKIKTMFFVEGEFVKARPNDVRNIVAAGHRLGLHTWDHKQLPKLSNDQIKQEFVKVDDLVKTITGRSMAPHWRPPYGAVNARVRGVAESLGFTKMWLWEVDSLDWKHKGNTAATIAEVEKGLLRADRKLCDVLFHDHATSVKALDELLPRLRAKGYEIVDFAP